MEIRRKARCSVADGGVRAHGINHMGPKAKEAQRKAGQNAQRKANVVPGEGKEEMDLDRSIDLEEDRNVASTAPVVARCVLGTHVMTCTERSAAVSARAPLGRVGPTRTISMQKYDATQVVAWMAVEYRRVESDSGRLPELRRDEPAVAPTVALLTI